MGQILESNSWPMFPIHTVYRDRHAVYVTTEYIQTVSLNRCALKMVQHLLPVQCTYTVYSIMYIEIDMLYEYV